MLPAAILADAFGQARCTIGRPSEKGRMSTLGRSASVSGALRQAAGRAPCHWTEGLSTARRTQESVGPTPERATVLSVSTPCSLYRSSSSSSGSCGSRSRELTAAVQPSVPLRRKRSAWRACFSAVRTCGPPRLPPTVPFGVPQRSRRCRARLSPHAFRSLLRCLLGLLRGGSRLLRAVQTGVAGHFFHAPDVPPQRTNREK